MEDSPLRHAFATPVYRRVWANADGTNEELRRLILERVPDEPEDHRSNVGGWHSANDLLTWQGPGIPQLTKWIQSAVNDATAALFKARDGQSPPERRVTIFAWANLLYDGGYNRVHDHDRFTWSGVYYVDAGEGVLGEGMNGHLEFIDPRNAVGEDFGAVLRLRPTPGAMVLFPGWLKHFVHPYKGSRPRISISFNVQMDRQPA